MPASSEMHCAGLLVSRSSFLKIENDFPRVTRPGEFDGFFELLKWKAMGDDRGNIDPALDERRHFVPGLEHFASVDSLQRQTVEDDDVPIDRGSRWHDAEERDFPAVKHVRQNIGE